MFDSYWQAALVAPAVLAALAAPVFVMAHRRGRTGTIRRFAVSGGVVSVMIVGIQFVSDRQVEQCIEAGNTACLDSGSPAMQLILTAAYALTAWWTARLIYDS